MRIGSQRMTSSTGTHGELVSNLQDLRDEAHRYATRARAANTLRGYRADWNSFADCDLKKLLAIETPVELVVFVVSFHPRLDRPRRSVPPLVGEALRHCAH